MGQLGIKKKLINENTTKLKKKIGENQLNEVVSFVQRLTNFERNGAIIMFVDETGFRLNETPKRLWASANMIAETNTALPPTRFSLIAVCSLTELIAFKLFDGSINAESYCGFMVQVFEGLNRAQKINVKPVVVLDNASIHKAIVARKLDALFQPLFLPPYCPQLNLIEYAFSPLKVFVKQETHLKSAFDFIELVVEVCLKVNRFSFGKLQRKFRRIVAFEVHEAQQKLDQHKDRDLRTEPKEL